MTPANAITTFRLFASPVFFIFALLPAWTGSFHTLSVIVLWLLFALIELSDMLDGAVARRTKGVSDLGKLLDPFADVISHLTYFVILVVFDIMPAWMFVLIMYREVGITFIRMMMVRMGVALAARSGGKLKTVFYAIGGALGLALISNAYLGWFFPFMDRLPTITLVVLGVSVALAWASFIDYLRIVVRHYRTAGSSGTVS